MGIFIIVIAVVLLMIFLLNLYNFLAITKPITTDVLVVEGWLMDFMLDGAAAEIQKGNYRLVLVTGVKKEFFETEENYKHIEQNTGTIQRPIASTAEIGASRLIQKGVAPALIEVIPVPETEGEYTFHAAMALKRWLVQKPGITRINLFTGGAHGRKSLIIYSRVLGKGITLGIISSAINHYNSRWWWSTAAGIKSVFRYFAGYLYALFWPFDTRIDKSAAK